MGFYSHSDGKFRLEGAVCVYCGEDMHRYDVFPPHLVSAVGIEFPSCNECTTFARNTSAIDFDQRVSAVKKKMRAKYTKASRFVPWGNDELTEMSDHLARGMEAWNAAKQRTHARLAWNAKSFLCRTVDISDFAQIGAKTGFSAGSEPRWLRRLRLWCECEYA